TDTINFARAGAVVTAVDLSARSLDLARQRAEIFGLTDRIRFMEADAERLSSFVEPQTYDLVYSFGVIHHSPHPERILGEIRRHFVDGNSVMKLMVYHRRSWKVIGILFTEARGAWWRLEEAVARHSEAQTGCPVTYTYSRRRAAALLAATGFRVLQSDVDHIFPYRVGDYVRYQYAKAAPFNILPQGATRALERRLGWHLCVTAMAVE
ncbi:MAG: class I SAM-dependent methyltransferase, partial [bacterium]